MTSCSSDLFTLGSAGGLYESQTLDFRNLGIDSDNSRMDLYGDEEIFFVLKDHTSSLRYVRISDWRDRDYGDWR